MGIQKSSATVLVGLCTVLSGASAAQSVPAQPDKVIARIDLSKPFRLPAGATFIATQRPPVLDPIYEGYQAPGRIHLCVRAAPGATCYPDLDAALKTGSQDDEFSEIHYLEISEVVRPRGLSAPPLLHIQVASFHAGNGSQIHAAVMLGYRPSEHRFERAFQEQFGGNNNQEARYIASGPLKGAMITVHPTDNAPFGYWIAVHPLTSDYRYKQVLRYRSATRYGDRNPLAVIDSEMPNILRRLGLWRSGEPLPVLKTACPRPHLVKSELWCS